MITAIHVDMPTHTYDDRGGPDDDAPPNIDRQGARYRDVLGNPGPIHTPKLHGEKFRIS